MGTWEMTPGAARRPMPTEADGQARLRDGRLVPYFDTFDEAGAAGLLTRTSWGRRGRRVADGTPPAGIVVRERSKVRPEVGAWIWPVLAEHPDHLLLADDWFEVFTVEQTSLPKEKESNSTPSREEQEGGESRGEGSSMTQKASETAATKPFPQNGTEPASRPANSVRAYVPEGLELPDHCPVKEQVWWFLGLIYWKHLEARDPWDAPVRLRYDHLRDNIPDWPAVWRWCERLELVERTAGYIPGEQAYGYTTALSYREQTHRLRTFDHKLLAKRLRAAEAKHLSRPVVVHLRRQLDRLTVDMAGFEGRHGAGPNQHYYRAHLRTIVDRYLRLIKDDFAGRIHTNVSNLYKPLRRFLRVDGEADTLGEVDIRNSQPLFLGLAAKRAGFEDESYLRLCEAGQIYDHLAARLGVLRAAAKDEMMKFLFAKNGFQSAAKAVFGREFPNTAAYMHEVKETDHVRLARHMQEAERRFVVDAVCVRLMRLRRDMFLTTIHDSVLARKPDGDLVVTVMREEFAKHGLRPTLVWGDVAEHDM